MTNPLGDKMPTHKSTAEYTIPDGFTLADLRELMDKVIDAPGTATVKAVVKFNGQVKTLKLEDRG